MVGGNSKSPGGVTVVDRTADTRNGEAWNGELAWNVGRVLAVGVVDWARCFQSTCSTEASSSHSSLAFHTSHINVLYYNF